MIGVQASGADAFTRSWRTGERVTGDVAATFAEGIATRWTFDLTFEILREHLDDIVTLDEEELREGIRLALRTTHNLAEGAGAAALAAAVKLREQLAGKTVACVMSGGNITNEVLRQVLEGIGDRRLEEEDRRQKTEDRRQKTGNRKQEDAPVSCLLSPVSCLLSVS